MKLFVFDAAAVFLPFLFKIIPYKLHRCVQGDKYTGKTGNHFKSKLFLLKVLEINQKVNEVCTMFINVEKNISNVYHKTS